MRTQAHSWYIITVDKHWMNTKLPHDSIAAVQRKSWSTVLNNMFCWVSWYVGYVVNCCLSLAKFYLLLWSSSSTCAFQKAVTKLKYILWFVNMTHESCIRVWLLLGLNSMYVLSWILKKHLITQENGITHCQVLKI